MQTSVLKIENLVKSYPGVEALKGISFEVGAGKIHGFLGPNGAGKSTTLNIISGLLQAGSGQVSFKGKPIDGSSYEFRSSIGYLPEQLPLYRNMSVEDFLKFVGSINSVSFKGSDKQLGKVIKECGLEDVKRRLIGNLSKGYAQRVGIASALIHDPEVVILDEPTSGLDPLAISEIRDLIKSLSKTHTILFSSHQLHEVELLCDEVTIIGNGQVITTGELSSVLGQNRSTTQLQVKLGSWDQAREQKLVEKFAGIQLESNASGEQTILKLQLPKGVTQAELSEFFVTEKCELLSLETTQKDLESIFKDLMGETRE
jgi:ABC-2 type transport system ATP-binding protein